MDNQEVQLRDTVKTTLSIVFTLTLNLAGESPTSRTLTIDYLGGGSAVPKANVASFRALLLGKFNKFVQPSGWRDTNEGELEWTITEVEAKVVDKTELKFDFNQ